MPHLRNLMLAASLAPLWAAPASAQVKEFRDWIVACDNGRACSAYGITETGGQFAFIWIGRGGEPQAEILVTITIDAVHGSRFRLAFDDGSPGGLPGDGLTKTAAGDVLSHSIEEPAAIEAFIAALRKAGKLVVTPVEIPGKDAAKAERGEVSLAGAAAALLWVDEQQKRLGTVTALIRRGDKPASAVPAPPALPVVTPAKPNAAPAPDKAPPAVLAKGRRVCGDDQPDAKLENTWRLSGDWLLYEFFCREMSGAYNMFSAFVVARQGEPQSARLLKPPYPASAGRQQEAAEMLVNPGFDPKTLRLTMFEKSRSPGDCGSSAEWAWTGQQFRLVRYGSMPKCAGLLSEYWPSLYRATVR